MAYFRTDTTGLRLDLLPGRQHGPGEDPYLDITRLTKDTGFTPAFDVDAAVADYVPGAGAIRADQNRLEKVPGVVSVHGWAVRRGSEGGNHRSEDGNR